MSGKAKFIFGTYIAAALVVLSLCCAIGYSRLRDYRQAAAYSSRASFETTVKAVAWASFHMLCQSNETRRPLRRK